MDFDVDNVQRHELVNGDSAIYKVIIIIIQSTPLLGSSNDICDLFSVSSAFNFNEWDK